MPPLSGEGRLQTELGCSRKEGSYSPFYGNSGSVRGLPVMCSTASPSPHDSGFCRFRTTYHNPRLTETLHLS